MKRRIAAADTLAALCTLMLAVLLLSQAAVPAAGGVELDAGGTSREADSLPEPPGEADPTGEANSPNDPGVPGSPADPSADDPDPDLDPLDKPPSRNGGRPNGPLTAHAPPTGDRSSSVRAVRAAPPHSGCCTNPRCTGHNPGPPGQRPAARPAVLQVFRL
ncbi:hypothetical protein [Streptomyces sp. NPDC001820]|uniref:hypothetical protein n=1 Tax=Streptomyces sp. NPDC001820 TaxID=3364613 RepID=UPI0036744AC5